MSELIVPSAKPADARASTNPASTSVSNSTTSPPLGPPEPVARAGPQCQGPDVLIGVHVRAEGEVSLADLAAEYSVGRSTIHRIIHRPSQTARRSRPDRWLTQGTPRWRLAVVSGVPGLLRHRGSACGGSTAGCCLGRLPEHGTRRQHSRGADQPRMRWPGRHEVHPHGWP
jgi:hypothetical protein